MGAHLLLAVVYFNTERFGEAKTSLTTCIRTAPDLLGLYLFRALISGERGNRALLKINESPANAVEWRLEAAESFAAAEEDYRHALELRPDSNFRYVLLVNRGGMYLQAGRLDRAHADLEAAVAARRQTLSMPMPIWHRCFSGKAGSTWPPRRSTAPSNGSPTAPSCSAPAPSLSPVRMRKGGNQTSDLTPAQRTGAIRDLEQAIRLERKDSPQTADDHAERGRLLFASGQTAEALTAYEAALQIVPDDLKALRLRALALLEQEKYDDVLAASDAFLAKGKPSADLLEIRGQARLARKDFGGAIADYTVALSLDSWVAHAHEPPRLGLSVLRRLQAGPGRFRRGTTASIPAWDRPIAAGEWLASAWGAGATPWPTLKRPFDWPRGTQKQRAYFNAARVNALSLKFAAEEVSRRGEAGLSLHRKLRDRAGRSCSDRSASFPPTSRPPSGERWSPRTQSCGRSSRSSQLLVVGTQQAVRSGLKECAP